MFLTRLPQNQHPAHQGPQLEMRQSEMKTSECVSTLAGAMKSCYAGLSTPPPPLHIAQTSVAVASESLCLGDYIDCMDV